MTHDPAIEKVVTPAAGHLTAASNASGLGYFYPTPFIDLPGTNTSEVRIFAGDTLPLSQAIDPTLEPSGISNAQLFEVDQFNGRIRFIHPAIQFMAVGQFGTRGGTLLANELYLYTQGAYAGLAGYEIATNKLYFLSMHELISQPTFEITRSGAGVFTAVSPADVSRGIYFIDSTSGIARTVWIISNASTYVGALTNDSYSVRNTTTVTYNLPGTFGHAFFHARYNRSAVNTGGGTVVINTGDYLERRVAWPAWADAIRAAAGKFEASTVTGDGCWRDYGGSFYWDVKGSVGGGYDPAWSNKPYVSSKVQADGKTHASTREFAFQINVAAACVAQLLPGDSISLAIGDAAWPATYQVGDTMSLSIIAAQDLFLSGGQAGTNLQTWYINGSVDGPRAPYIYDPAAPAPYSASGLGFTLTPGTIPFAKSDEFKFNIEGGHYRWRKDAGAWSANFDISTAALAFTDGLTIQFVPGAAPSFAPSDLHKFRVLQPNRVSNLRKPNFDQWAWDGANATLEIDFGAAQLIDAIMLTYHTLPSAAALTIEFATTQGVYGTPVALTFHEHVIGKLLETPLSARYARLTISGAPFGRIGWLWLGSMLASECCQGEVKLRYDYNIERAGLINGGAQAYGKTVSGEIKWDTGALTDTDRVNFVQMFDHVKLNHDQAVVIYPHFLHQDEAYLARILDDKIEIADWNLYHPNDKANRALSVTLPFEGVIL